MFFICKKGKRGEEMIKRLGQKLKEKQDKNLMIGILLGSVATSIGAIIGAIMYA